MQQISFNVSKDNVWEEVAKITGYTGGKMAGDETAYERILMTDEDAKSLHRFWEEAEAVANDTLKEMIIAIGESERNYMVTLEVSNSYDQILNRSVQVALEGYFISAITGSWYRFANKEEAEAYFNDAGAKLDEVSRKLYSRRRPTRPVRNH